MILDPYTVRFILHEPWPDFMAFYRMLATAASGITAKSYFEWGLDQYDEIPGANGVSDLGFRGHVSNAVARVQLVRRNG